MARSTTVIVGAGHAGGRTARALRDRGYDGRIVLLGEEPYRPYERPALSKELLLDGRAPAGMWIAGEATWRELDVELRLGSGARAVDRDAGVVRLADASALAFDHLVVATGGRPRRLELPGAQEAGRDPAVHVVRSLDDALGLAAALGAGPVVIVGGGVIGLEVAAAARTRGCEATVLEAGPRVMGRAGFPEVAAWLTALHRRNGVTLHTGAAVRAIERTGSSLVVRVLSAEGEALALPAANVVMAVGIRPALDLLAGSDLSVGDGLVLDAQCRAPEDPRVFAAGDAACAFNRFLGRHARLETWRNAETQAEVVAAAIAGQPLDYAEVPWFWTDQFGANLQVLGGTESWDRVVWRGTAEDDAFTMIALKGQRVVGAALVNQGANRRPIERLMRSGQPILPERLADTGVRLKSLVAA